MRTRPPFLGLVMRGYFFLAAALFVFAGAFLEVLFLEVAFFLDTVFFFEAAFFLDTVFFFGAPFFLAAPFFFGTGMAFLPVEVHRFIQTVLSTIASRLQMRNALRGLGSFHRLA